ncbi:MAG: enoyl-CoA hydratase/isomerase family protein [Spirochaetia bacterium]|nr:enoyl-CoA hydratase/isomerase family protein [Spirochaetia bacterium]
MKINRFQHLSIEIENSLATIRLNRFADNSMNVEMLKEITQAHNEIEIQNNVKAVLLTSSIEGFFSNGLDLHDLLAADVKGKIEIFKNLYIMCSAIYSSSKVHVSLLNGHAMAGGAVLAAMSDFRFIINGPYRIGFSESKIGLGLPEVFLNIIESIIGSQNLKNTVLLGQAYKPAEALKIGLVDEILNSENAEEKVQKYILKTLQIPRQSFQAIKTAMRTKNIRLFQTQMSATLDWFSMFFNETLDEGLLAVKEKRRPHFK